MRDVAERAQVSVSTVSHVLNGTRNVADGTREGVLAAIEALGYQPNLLAKSLKTRRTFTRGLLISDIQNSFFTSVVRGVEDLALSRGYHLFLCNTDEDASRENEYITELLKKRVDGLIIASATPRQDRAWRPEMMDTPFVFLDREVQGTEADVIRVDNRRAMGLIADHLVGLGHRRIGLVSGPLDKASGYERHLGLRSALAELGSNLEDSLVRFGDFRISSGREKTEELLSLSHHPTALVAANNQMTLGALLAVKEKGLKIPDDISVVGFDEPEWAPLVYPPLTTLAQPTYEMGVGAVRMLLERIEGLEATARTRLLEPWLEIRESTSPPGKSNREGRGSSERFLEMV
ncbi:MAG: LacI family DNA-binding transcriptional regulator [Rubrobacteraceae bacterium]